MGVSAIKLTIVDAVTLTLNQATHDVKRLIVTTTTKNPLHDLVETCNVSEHAFVSCTGPV
jgi:hypothetical protein